MNNRRITNNLDYVLLGSVMLLVLIGITLIGSATHANIPSPTRFSFVFRQSGFVMINLILGFFLLRFDYRMLKGLSVGQASVHP